MRLTITGNLEQVLDACTLAGASPINPRRKNRAKADYEQVVARRRLIRRAFDMIRHDPAERALVDQLAAGLGGIRGEITESLLDTAREIISGKRRR